LRRHCERRVIGQHRGNRSDVIALPCVHVTLHGLAQPVVADRAQRRLLAARGQPLLNGLARTLQGAVDGRGCRIERLCDLARRESEHVAAGLQHLP
jgi:hypothetical protein